MKYLDEYRDVKKVKYLVDEIRSITTGEWNIMEICGGQTHSLVKNGIIDLLPDKITMIHGPGCPVCVTPVDMIDKAIELALDKQVILCSFGDMLRVPGTKKSLLKAKAEGADVRIVYSPLDALKIASKNPHREIVFFAVGFETTAPANALSVIQAEKMGLRNYSILASHVLVPPAMEAILNDEYSDIDGFLAAGHVCTVMGTREYTSVINKYGVPVVVTGFEPVDLLKGILSCVKLLEKGKASLDNQYSRVVSDDGNIEAQKLINEVFVRGMRNWRGIGSIPDSGLVMKEKYDIYNAERKFRLKKQEQVISNECMAGSVLKGVIKPNQCPFFGNQCTPDNPMGAPMVSSEGACAAYYDVGYEYVED